VDSLGAKAAYNTTQNLWAETRMDRNNGKSHRLGKRISGRKLGFSAKSTGPDAQRKP
jgi:hypothetical protein